MAHCKGDWMGQTLIECDYGAWRVQFKYPASYFWNMHLTCRSCNLNVFVGPRACIAFKVLADTELISQVIFFS